MRNDLKMAKQTECFIWAKLRSSTLLSFNGNSNIKWRTMCLHNNGPIKHNIDRRKMRLENTNNIIKNHEGTSHKLKTETMIEKKNDKAKRNAATDKKRHATEKWSNDDRTNNSEGALRGFSKGNALNSKGVSRDKKKSRNACFERKRIEERECVADVLCATRHILFLSNTLLSLNARSPTTKQLGRHVHVRGFLQKR